MGNRRRMLTVLVSVIVVVVALSSSVRDLSSAPPARSPATTSCGDRLAIGDASVACLTVVHVSADIGPIDVSLDDMRVVNGVPAMSQSPFIAVAAGTYDAKANATDDPEAIVADRRRTTLTAGAAYELVLLGSQADGTVRLTPLSVDASPGTAGSGRLRIVQAVADAPTLTIHDGDQPVATDLAPLNVSDYTNVRAGTLPITVTLSGSARPIFPAGSVMVAAGGATTVYVVGTMTGPAAVRIARRHHPRGSRRRHRYPSALTPDGESRSTCCCH